MISIKNFLPILIMGSVISACDTHELESAQNTDKAGGSITRMDPRLDAIVPPKTNIEKLAGGFIFLEGPVWHKETKQLFFSDVRDNASYVWSEEAGVSDFIKPIFSGKANGRSVWSNGLTIDKNGCLIILEHGHRRLSKACLTEPIQRKILADNYNGQRFNSPNDSTWHSDGSLYFTDPPYGLADLESDPERDLNFNGIYRLKTDGTIDLLFAGQSRPNGIALSPDEKILYVANSDAADKVWFAYDVLYDGSLVNPRIFFDANDQAAPGAPDGMKVDLNGNIFATGPGGVWIFDSAGTHLGTINTGEVTANVAWGNDGSMLYLTSSTSLYRIKLNTRGEIL